MIKQNVKIILLGALLLLPLLYLIILNKKQQKLISSQEQIIKIQTKKIYQYDSSSKSLIQILKKYNIDFKDDLASSEFFESISNVFSSQAFLIDSLVLQTKKNQTLITEFNDIKYQLESKNNLLNRLKVKWDSIAFLSKQLAFKNDNLVQKINKINKINDSLLNAKTDTISLLSPKNNKIFYFGNLDSGLPRGFGIGFYENKGYYIGNWSENMRNGNGKHFYLNGDIYIGAFKNDIREGFGTYYYQTGDVYEGWWKNDLMNGEGTIIFNDGKKKSGIWLDGKLIDVK